MLKSNHYCPKYEVSKKCQKNAPICSSIHTLVPLPVCIYIHQGKTVWYFLDFLFPIFNIYQWIKYQSLWLIPTLLIYVMYIIHALPLNSYFVVCLIHVSLVYDSSKIVNTNTTLWTTCLFPSIQQFTCLFQFSFQIHGSDAFCIDRVPVMDLKYFLPGHSWTIVENHFQPANEEAPYSWQHHDFLTFFFRIWFSYSIIVIRL